MSKPLVYRAAQIRLAEIWDYTVEKWGEEQADKYLRALGACMEELASKRHLWRRVKDKRLPGIYFLRCRHHYIFFRDLYDQIPAISILHESMDIVQRLHEDNEVEP